MANVYVAAVALAAIGVGIAVVDSNVRPIKSESLNPGKVGATPAKGPEVTAAPPTPVTPPGVAPGVGVKVEAPADVNVDALGVQISIAEAMGLFNTGSVFVDVRKGEDFGAGHVQGAIHVALDAMTSGGPEWGAFFKGADFATAHVVYCNGGDCHESEEARAIMMQAGFKRVFVMKDGFPGWRDGGGASEPGGK
jgi:rhodanese-related sulfurtransferase